MELKNLPLQHADQALSPLTGLSQVQPVRSPSTRVNVGDTERVVSAVAGLALAYAGLRHPTRWRNWLLTTLGGYLLYRGSSGNCPVNTALGRDTSDPVTPDPEPIEAVRSLTINRPRAELYRFWRRHENLPQFMQHVQSVTQTDDKHSHWVIPVLGGATTMEYDAEIVEEVEDERLVWRSLPGSLVDHAGEVRFVDAPGGRGTELHCVMRYTPPAGALGHAVAKLFNPAFRQLVSEDLRRFKRLVETGEIPISEAQPSGKRVAESAVPYQKEARYESPVF